MGKGFLFLERQRPAQYKWNPDYPYDDLKVLFEKYSIISGVDNCHHFIPDIEIGLKLGWGGILKKLKGQRKLRNKTHYKFYDSEIAVVTSIIEFIKRAGNEIKQLAYKENNPYLKDNLFKMSEISLKVVSEVPETIHKAVQWICWFSMLSRTYNRGSAGGQLKTMLTAKERFKLGKYLV